MNSPSIWVTTGLPASGKSTFAKSMVTESKGATVRVNLDDIRDMMGFGHTGTLAWSKELEQTALKFQDEMIVRGIKEGRSVVIDNTHLNKNLPNRYKKLFDGDVQFFVADFTHVDVATCIARDIERGARGQRMAGEKVIMGMARQLNKSWRLTAEYMNDVKLSPPLEYDPNLPWAVVFDTDGTTAHHNRSPYDYARCHTDSVDPQVRMFLRIINEQGAFDSIALIGMSGRPDTWRDMTEQWYKSNHIWYDEFYMRAAGDGRNDADVKQEMVDKHIRGRYNVLLWLDDRDRVVRRIRKLGIKVAQVAEGDF
jgi:predicted kinase